MNEQIERAIKEFAAERANIIISVDYELLAKHIASVVAPIVMRSLPSKLDVDDYTIQSYHSKTVRNSIWIENVLGEGMEVRLDELWREKF